MNKRSLVLSILEDGKEPGPVPAAFFLHFDPSYRRGQPAIDKHLEYFRYTGMDLVKIQYEHPYPRLESIQKPSDWGKMPRYGTDFFEEPLRVVEGLVKAAKHEALIIVTLYSPFMCAGHAVDADVRDRHMVENPAAIRPGMEAVTDSVLTFVRECVRLGVDGFYASTQGAESHRFGEVGIFNECVRPYDLAVMEEINRTCSFNILHICDYHDSYKDYAPFLDYPGHVVNCNLNLDSGKISARQVSEMFQRPFMGGLERKGILATGTPEAITAEVSSVLLEAPPRFLLAADCTVPSDTSWDHLKLAIETAHQYRL